MATELEVAIVIAPGSHYPDLRTETFPIDLMINEKIVLDSAKLRPRDKLVTIESTNETASCVQLDACESPGNKWAVIQALEFAARRVDGHREYGEDSSIAPKLDNIERPEIRSSSR